MSDPDPKTRNISEGSPIPLSHHIDWIEKNVQERHDERIRWLAELRKERELRLNASQLLRTIQAKLLSGDVRSAIKMIENYLKQEK